MDINIVVIDDNQKMQEDSLIWSLEDRFGKGNVHFFLTPKDGLVFIKENLQKNIIVLLDINFPEDQIDGHKALEEITGMSKLIPVILWSAIDENKEKFSDFINNHAFGFISKTATIEEAIQIIDKAVKFLEFSIDNVIEDWIIDKNEDKDKPVYITSDGSSYSLNDILREIRQQSEVGKEFTKKFNELTIDLIIRNKENLNE
ncbi:response regulator [Flagellimonas oceanensis]|uniref:response regulator n=1 Tax=Flagellimonas oceanensis TaxID=2499163 RepID=UPI000F8E58D7|nr:response regulator [Allomuricauda oceanensis]